MPTLLVRLSVNVRQRIFERATDINRQSHHYGFLYTFFPRPPYVDSGLPMTAKRSNNIARGRAAHPGLRGLKSGRNPAGVLQRASSLPPIRKTPAGFRAISSSLDPGCAARPWALLFGPRWGLTRRPTFIDSRTTTRCGRSGVLAPVRQREEDREKAKGREGENGRRR